MRMVEYMYGWCVVNVLLGGNFVLIFGVFWLGFVEFWWYFEGV